MQQLKARLTGISPLLMHSERSANPLDKQTQAHKKLTLKKAKTDEDQEAITKSEWMLGLYFRDDIGPFIPTQNIDATLLSGAKLRKLGTKVKRGVMILEDAVPLQYDGPRKLDLLYASERFRDVRGVRVGMKRIQRCRPKFDQWALEFTLVVDNEQVEDREVKVALEDAGRYIGLGDFRPRFGKFEVEFL
jgi:hypothetical protein